MRLFYFIKFQLKLTQKTLQKSVVLPESIDPIITNILPVGILIKIIIINKIIIIKKISKNPVK